MKHTSLLAVTALTMAMAAGAAKADTITNTFTFAPLQGSAFEDGPSFAQFNPALGTLNSVTLNFSATGTFTGADAHDFNYVAYVFVLKGNGQSLLEEASYSSLGDGTGSADVDETSNNTAPFVGLGTISTATEAKHGAGSANLSSTFGTESVTYNYTSATPPTAVTPEPGSIVLLGTGLLGAAATLRRRFIS